MFKDHMPIKVRQSERLETSAIALNGDNWCEEAEAISVSFISV